MVEAQNDTYMVTEDAINCDDNLKEALQSGKITRGQLQRNAMNVIRYAMNSRAFNRFIKNGGALEKSLLSSIDALKEVAIIDFLQCDEPYKIAVDKPGRYLLKVEYLSAQPEISQFTINIKINDKSATSVTVNGTLGTIRTLYREVSIAHKDIEVLLTYPCELLEVKSCVLLSER